MQTKTLLALIGAVLILGGSACAQTVGATPSPALSPTLGTTYYVRTDGGSTTQCTGQADAAYPGSGTGQLCAWDHPFRALPPGGPPRIAGGDTLIIAAGSYMMGYGAPGTTGLCDEAESAFDCLMPPIPSGAASQPTRILGEGWDSGCANPPQLWGNERPWFIVNLTDSDYVELGCLEITDHSGCVESHSGSLECERDTPPYGPWAAVGLYAEDSTGVYLHDLNIHGLASGGIHAGRLTNWTVEDVRIAGNGWSGWDGDIGESSANTGTLTFRRWTVEWNGCGETYPGGQPTGCWAQTAGGYGDGVGTGATGGDWLIEDSSFLHNTSDGLDLLYHSEGGRVVLDRVHAEGNAGNQVKITGQSVITNSVLIGNCAFFDGKPFTYDVDNCRALGNTLEIVYAGGESVSIVNSTLTGQGDGLVGGGAREGFSCSGAETLTARNNVFVGEEEFLSPDDNSFLFYQEGCADLEMDSNYNIAYNVKNITCGVNGVYVNSGAHDLCQDPQLFGTVPLSGSPALDAGSNAVCPAVDIRGAARPTDDDGDGNAVCDMGAFEGAATLTANYLPVVTRTYGTSSPTIAGCPILPADNIWNTPVDTLPLDGNSAAYVATIGASAHVHADFGSGLWNGGPIGIPYTNVPGSQTKVAISFYYPDESDPGPYPIPANAPIEGGSGSDGDRHVLVIERTNCILYEVYDSWPQANGSWDAGSGAVYDLRSNALRPSGWTSADAAGLPILPGLVRYDEVAAGEILHAIRFTAPQTRQAYVWPARHYASSLTGAQYPPMGQRFRLRANYDISGFSPQVQVILRAFKKYGMILADNGSAWYISGAPDARWNNDVLHELSQVPGSAFEAVSVSSLMISPNSGQVNR